MKPQQPMEMTHQNEQTTSPWMEVGDAWSSQATAQAATSERPYDQDSQTPTHDALSDIYNRGY
jgi:hypothetical protein